MGSHDDSGEIERQIRKAQVDIRNGIIHLGCPVFTAALILEADDEKIREERRARRR